MNYGFLFQYFLFSKGLEFIQLVCLFVLMEILNIKGVKIYSDIFFISNFQCSFGVIYFRKLCLNFRFFFRDLYVYSYSYVLLNVYRVNVRGSRDSVRGLVKKYV